MPLLLVIAVGGVLGSLARFGVAEALGPWEGSGLPWGTLVVNLLGCVAIGVIATSAWATSRAWLRPFLITGVLGGFTTFSALALETGLLLDSGQVPLAVGYVLLTMSAGLLAVRVGALANRRRA